MAQTITINLSGKEDATKEKLSDVQLKINDEQLTISGLPDADVLEYVARDCTNKFYVVHRPKENWDYDSFRLHIGLENQLVEAHVEHVNRFRDGGTTIIDYVLSGKNGHLHFPSPLKKEAKPTNTYNGKTESLELLI